MLGEILFGIVLAACVTLPLIGLACGMAKGEDDRAFSRRHAWNGVAGHPRPPREPA